MKIGIAQIAPVWLNKNETLQKVISFISGAGKQRGNLVTF